MDIKDAFGKALAYKFRSRQEFREKTEEILFNTLLACEYISRPLYRPFVRAKDKILSWRESLEESNSGI